MLIPTKLAYRLKYPNTFWGYLKFYQQWTLKKLCSKDLIL